MFTRRGIMAGEWQLASSACRRSGEKLIGVVPKATSHLFFLSVHAGVDQAARDFMSRRSGMDLRTRPIMRDKLRSWMRWSRVKFPL